MDLKFKPEEILFLVDVVNGSYSRNKEEEELKEEILKKFKLKLFGELF